MDRKYMSEFSVNVWNDRVILLQSDGLSDPRLKDISPHIYMILSRKRCSLKSQKITKDNPNIELFFDGLPPISIKMWENEQSDADLEISRDMFELKTLNGRKIISGKVSLFLNNLRYMQKIGSELNDLFKYEILYIGQAFGKDGKRIATARLGAHETLQEIYSDCNMKYPDREIWLLLLPFEWNVLSSVANAPINVTNDNAHIQDVLSNPLDERQVVNLIEGALIKHFYPKYNIRLKDTFPSPCHTSYNNCYKLDYNAVTVALALDELMYPVGNTFAGYKYRHIFNILFHNEVERKSMFDFD